MSPVALRALALPGLALRALTLALLLLLAARPALAQKAGAGEKEIARVGSFVVFSDMELEAERAKTVLARVEAAYAFVGAEQRWAEDAVLGHDLGVRVVSDARMKETSRTAKGVAIGKDTFLVAASFLEQERSARTLAHELTHLQDRRHLEAKGSRVPHWFSEGRAVAMGRAYEARLGVVDTRYDANVARVASDVTVAEARRILEDDAYLAEKKMPSVFRMEALGFFFLEFVRVHFQLQDLEPRLAKVVVRVGEGKTLEEAFAREVGTGLAAARDAFYAFLEETSGRERLRGTVLQGVR